MASPKMDTSRYGECQEKQYRLIDTFDRSTAKCIGSDMIKRISKNQQDTGPAFHKKQIENAPCRATMDSDGKLKHGRGKYEDIIAVITAILCVGADAWAAWKLCGALCGGISEVCWVAVCVVDSA